MSETPVIKTLIVDDSAQARKLLSLMIEEAGLPVLVAGEASGVDEALEMIDRLKPDLIFLDIEMPGKSGLVLTQELSLRDEVPCVVFTTAYNQYALQAFRLSAVDYLLKPIDEEQLEQAVKKVTEKMQGRRSAQKLKSLLENMNPGLDKTISLSGQNGQEFIRVNDIICLRAEGSYTHVSVMGRKPLLVSKNLKHFEILLSEMTQFYRSHRSFLVNLRHVKKVERLTIHLSQDTFADLTREKKEEFMNRMR